ncbi:MAG: autotransporter domain-containing protein [Fusobacterium ulcerans]|uniref:autotransporter family protein n=1 Tax=Fusobacterium ulcerans TaxID=861 RepID=UPI003A8BCF09
MIEKIMRAVKSNNKKRGRNITVGIVVGMLLSCTAIMGKDVVGLEIGKENDTIIFKDGNGNKFDPERSEGNPYPSNKWDIEKNTYTNNSIIIRETTSGDNGIGLKLSDNLKVNLTNNGVITGSGSGSGSGYGIDISNLTGNLTNNGIITGSDSDYSSGIVIISLTGNLTNNGIITGFDPGIYIYSLTGNLTNNGIITGFGSSSDYGSGIVITSLTGNLTNNGIITGSGSGSGSGIWITSLTGNLTNNGIITGFGSSSGYGYGISMPTLTGNLTNTGVIIGSDYGIWITSSLTGNLTNTGAVYGSTNAIKIASTGTTKSAYNCGLLVTDGSKAVEGIVDFAHNYGLAFTVKDGKYTLDSTLLGEFGKISPNKDVVIDYEKDADGKLDFNKPITEKYTIVNAKEDKSGSDIKGTVSMKLENGMLFHDDSDTLGIKDFSSDKKYILNGITDTLLVKGKNNKVNNSIINAYKTAVVMNENKSMLTLGNTVINGGLDGTSPVVSMTGTDNILSVEEKSTINGKIESAGANNTITIKESIINGDILGVTGGGNTLNLIGNRDEKRVVIYNNTMNIFHNIGGFENINIGNNVAFYEDAKITDVGKINIQKDGILVLRISSTSSANTHALSSNTGGTISSENGGKLLLALNGVSDKSEIDIGMDLDNSIYGTENKDIEYRDKFTLDTTSILHSLSKKAEDNSIVIVDTKSKLPLSPTAPDGLNYAQLNKIYQSMRVIDGVKEFDVTDDEKLSAFLGYLNDIYAGSPYSYSSELSRKSAGMFRDIVTDNIFKADAGKWMMYGGLTHVDGGTKDTYYGKGYYTYDIGSSDMDADTKITGAYMLEEYGISDTLTSGVVIGGNKLKSDLSNASKVDGSALYLGAYAKKYIGNLKVTAGAGFQYGDYDADRLAVNKVASSTGESVMKYSDNYNDMTYDIYLNGRYSHQVGDNLFLEPYTTLSYTYVDQDGANEGSKVLAIETDSKSFDYTVGKVGVDLKKVIPHEKGKSTLSAGVSYTKIFDGADEEHITGRFKGGSDFDILVAHKNEHSIGLNAKYALELESGIIFDVKGSYSVERDSHNGSGKNKTKGEWIVGAGMGYKF